MFVRSEVMFIWVEQIKASIGSGPKPVFPVFIKRKYDVAADATLFFIVMYKYLCVVILCVYAKKPRVGTDPPCIVGFFEERN
jgi:hypothetical protein